MTNVFKEYEAVFYCSLFNHLHHSVVRIGRDETFNLILNIYTHLIYPGFFKILYFHFFIFYFIL